MGSTKLTASTIAARAGHLGPVATVLRLCRVGDDDDPVSRMSRALESVDKRLAKELGPIGFNELLRTTGAVFRLIGEFSAAAHYFHRATANDELDNLAEIAYQYGDLKAMQKLDGYAAKDGRERLFTNTRTLHDFVIDKVIPAIDIGGDQYRGFFLDERALREIDEAVPEASLEQLIGQAVERIAAHRNVDLATKYILVSHSSAKELALELSPQFAAIAARPRQRATEIIEKAFPDAQIRILRQGDTLSVRPRQRFVFEIIEPSGQRCVLKELLPLVGELNGERWLSEEEQILARLEIAGVPRALAIVELEGLRFLRLCHFQGERLPHLLGQKAPLPFPEALSLCRQLATIVAELHRAGVAHLDIRDGNVLWDGRTASLVGFDKARSLTETPVWHRPGAAPFVAPEVAARYQAGRAADCFQLGLVFHRVATGRHPFGRPVVPTPEGGNRRLMLVEYAIPALLLPPNLDEQCSSTRFISIVRQLLHKDHSQRMTAKEAQQELISLEG